MARARSSTRRAIGPGWTHSQGRVLDSAAGRLKPSIVSRPPVGFSPWMPQEWHGWRMLPPPSLPRPRGEPPAAMSAASPPVDSTHRSTQIPRIVGAAVERVVRFHHQAELRDIGLAQQDRAGLAEPGDERGIVRRHSPSPTGDTQSRRRARRGEELLDGERYAVEKSKRHTSVTGDVRRQRLIPGPAEKRYGQRAESRVDLLDAPDVGLDHPAAGQIACRNPSRDLGSPHGRDLISPGHGHVMVL